MSAEAASVEGPMLLGNFVPDNVPAALLAKVIKDNIIFADVINAGAMAGTGLTNPEAANHGMSKNHWLWRVLISGDVGEDGDGQTWLIQFGINIKPIPSIGSMEGHYVGSSRVGRVDHSSDEVFSDVDSANKPPALGSEGGVPAALPAAAAGGNGSGRNGSGSGGGEFAVFSDVGSQDIPPSIASSGGGVIQQPTEGAPFPGVFDIKVRDRSGPSNAVLAVFSFDLAAGTTFGQLLNALTKRGMEPFHFRKLGAAYLGCRDFISQAAAAWLNDGLMMTGNSCEMPEKHIYSLLCWRYTRPLVSANLSDSDDQSTERATGRTPNTIDRAVWPAGYVHIEDARLQYNQAVNA